MTRYTIGIDIGGTNTDAVIIDQNDSILACCKTPTSTFLLEQSVMTSIVQLLDMSAVKKSDIASIHIGTTHATNALLEAKNLYKAGLLRLAGHKPSSLPPCFGWPQHLKDTAFSGYAQVSGGLRCDQQEITPILGHEIREALKALIDTGMESLAILGIFSPLSPSQELFAKAIAQDILGKGFPITLSSDIGGMGCIERENATMLNAALKKPMQASFNNMQQVSNDLGIAAPLYITHNDGSTLDLSLALDKPLLTISSGPTNSFIGAAKLIGEKNAIIIDIGGTSSDIGIVLDGYPRRSFGRSMIGGIPLNFRMPDVLSLPIGGGSLIRQNDQHFTVGPDSIGSRLFEDGYVFGGSTLTLTDIAYKSSRTSKTSPHIQRIPIHDQCATEILESAVHRMQESIRLMRGRHDSIPVIAVGGAAFLIEHLPNVTIPTYSGVANAYGAALAEVSHTIEATIPLDNNHELLSRLKEETCKRATLKGAAKESVKIVHLEITPHHYIPDRKGKVVITASGRRHFPQQTLYSCRQ